MILNINNVLIGRLIYFILISVIAGAPWLGVMKGNQPFIYHGPPSLEDYSAAGRKATIQETASYEAASAKYYGSYKFAIHTDGQRTLAIIRLIEVIAGGLITIIGGFILGAQMMDNNIVFSKKVNV